MLQRESILHIVASTVNKRIGGMCRRDQSLCKDADCDWRDCRLGVVHRRRVAWVLGGVYQEQRSSCGYTKKCFDCMVMGMDALVMKLEGGLVERPSFLQVLKGLLTRGDPRALSLSENLFDLFSDEAINWDAASSIGRIAAQTEVLTKTNYAVTKVRTSYSDEDAQSIF